MAERWAGASGGVDVWASEEEGSSEEGRVARDWEARWRVMVLRPMRTWECSSGAGGTMMGTMVLGGVGEVGDVRLRFWERLPREGWMWVVRWWPRGERRLEGEGVCQFWGVLGS